VQWLLAAVSGGRSNCITGAFQAIEGFISGQKINLIVTCGINDLLNTGIGANVELVVSRILTQVIDINNKRKINATLITSIIPAAGYEDICIRTDFLIYLLGMGRFNNAGFIKMSKCFLQENRNTQYGKYKIIKSLYSQDGIHFSKKRKKTFKVVLKHWMLRMNV
jgi:hypothetical protein